MQRTFDIFEKLADGESIWRACVTGQYEAQRKLQELAESSENEFFAIDLKSRKRLMFNPPPDNLYKKTDHGKRIS